MKRFFLSCIVMVYGSTLLAQHDFDYGLGLQTHLQFAVVDEEYEEFNFGFGLEYEKPLKPWLSLIGKFNYQRFIASEELLGIQSIYPTGEFMNGQEVFYGYQLRRFSSFDLIAGPRLVLPLRNYRLQWDLGGGVSLLQRNIKPFSPFAPYDFIPPDNFNDFFGTFILHSQITNAFALDRLEKHWFQLFVRIRYQILWTDINNIVIEQPTESLYSAGLGIGYQFHFK